MKKVMVVEDSSLMLNIIRTFIITEEPSIKVIPAHSGEESIDLYKQELPDLVLMDLMMPGMDGITALTEIKKINPSARVIVCTALSDPEHQIIAKKAGCIDFIIKPFTKKNLLDTIKKNL